MSALLRDAHLVTAWVVVAANGSVGVWATAAHWRVRWRTRLLWWCTAVAQVLVFVQVGFGVAVMTLDDVEVRDFHMFYGFLALFSVAIIYAYRQQVEAHRHLLYGLGSLFVMGLALRAIFIDPV